MTQTEINTLAASFEESLSSLLKGIEDAARKQFAYTVTTNIPAGITEVDDAIDDCLDHGIAVAHSARHSYCTNAAVALAGAILEQSNCHTEAHVIRVIRAA
jgi:hypothetical protein